MENPTIKPNQANAYHRDAALATMGDEERARIAARS